MSIDNTLTLVRKRLCSSDQDDASIPPLREYQDIHRLGKKAKREESSQSLRADLKPIAEDIFRRYKAKNNNLPDRVIYWRDGIAESQVPAFTESGIKTLMDVRDKCGKTGRST